MRHGAVRRVAFVIVALASLWSFVPVTVHSEVKETPPLRYYSRGVTFFLSEEARVKAISVEAAYRAGLEMGLPEGATRPRDDEIVAGVGCCGVLLGDMEGAVVEALGKAVSRWRSGPSTHLVYQDVWVLLGGQGVSCVCTAREGVRVAGGIGVGASREEAIEAYGSVDDDWQIAYGVPKVPSVAGDSLGIGMAWHSRIAKGLFCALVVSLVICLFLTPLPRGPAWAVVVLACVGVWIGCPLARLIWGWIAAIEFRAGPISLEDFLEALWAWLEGAPSRGGVGSTYGDYVAGSFRAWLRAPVPEAYALGTVVGLFAAGRLAARRLRRSGLAVYLLAGLGGVVLGTVAAAVVAALRPAQPAIMTLLWGPRTWHPLTAAALPSLALVACFLLLACQARRWWRATVLALGVGIPPGEEDAG